MDDKQLVKKINSGDTQAFEQLFRKYYESLVRFVYRYVQSTHISEELVQDVFAKLWEDRKTISTEGTIKSFLYKSTKNNALDHIRHQKVIDKYEDLVIDLIYDQHSENSLINTSGKEFRNAVQEAVESLPEKTRNIYKLSRADGFTYREISNIMEISIKTVESHMSKALRLLRQRLSPFVPTLAIVLPLI